MCVGEMRDEPAVVVEVERGGDVVAGFVPVIGKTKQRKVRERNGSEEEREENKVWERGETVCCDSEFGGEGMNGRRSVWNTGILRLRLRMTGFCIFETVSGQGRWGRRSAGRMRPARWGRRFFRTVRGCE